MKKFKLGIFLSVLLSVLCLFTACSDTEFYGSVFNAKAFEQKCSVTVADEVTDYEMDYTVRAQKFVSVSGESTVTSVYDAATAKKVYEVEGEGVTVESVLSNRAFLVRGLVEEKADLRRITDGELLATLDEEEVDELASVSTNLFRAGNNILWYNSTDEQLEVLVKDNPFLAIPSIDLSLGTTSKYFYYASGSKIIVYGRNLLPVASCELDTADVTGSKVAVLENGNVFVQLIKSVPEDADYEFTAEGNKYNVDHYVFDVKNDKLKAYDDVEFLVYTVQNKVNTGFEKISSDVTNIVTYIPFEEGGAVSDSSADYKFADMSNKLKLGDVYSVNFAERKLASPLTKVGGVKYYIASDRSGYNRTIIDEKSNFVADLSMVSYNLSYLIADGAIYDYNKTKLYDFEEDGLAVYKVLAKAVILKSKTESRYYMYVGTTKKELGTLGSTVTEKRLVNGSSYDAVYMVAYGSAYDYYNSYGEKILTTDCELYACARYGDSFYMRNETNSKYWRLHN